ncbi:hypothetical protein GCM10027194_05170 [Thalassiella azotivora]
MSHCLSPDSSREVSGLGSPQVAQHGTAAPTTPSRASAVASRRTTPTARDDPDTRKDGSSIRCRTRIVKLRPGGHASTTQARIVSGSASGNTVRAAITARSTS